MAAKDEDNKGQSQGKNESKAQKEQREAEEANAANPAHRHSVEDGDHRALATPEDSPLQGVYQGNPEGDEYVGLLAAQTNPIDPMAEAEKQQEQNYPRLPEEYFDPKEQEPEEARVGAAATSRSSVGRWVVVEHECLHGDEAFMPGVQELPGGVADALIAEGLAFEPAGKKGGR